VEAGDVRVTVLGTRFAVEMDARGVAVAVESGRVVVQTTRGVERLELGAGDAARVDSGSEPRRAAPRAANTVAPWRTGWLDFDRLPLGEAVAQLNRYRPAARITVDPAVAALPVLARVNIPRSTQWLQGLPGVLPVKVSVAEDGGATISPR
jgi:ferric-dicitrate binding protein FerR (iron transport regulator)